MLSKADTPPLLMLECTSAVVGAARGGWLAREVLPRWHACSLDRECAYPSDARANDNQRRDQSGLNAAICGLALGGDATAMRAFAPHGAGGRGAAPLCHRGKRWWMYSGQENFLPTDDEAAWSEMVLFSRRAATPKPYARHVMYRTP